MTRSTTMQMVGTRCAAVFAVLVLGVSLCCSQALGNADRYLIGFGARACGLADACATEYSDISGMYWNPATLAFMQNSSVMADIIHQPDDQLSHEAVAFPLRFGHHSVLGVGITAGQLGLADSLGNSVAGKQYGIDIGTAVAITPTFSFGTRARFQYELEPNVRTWTGAIALGLLYAPSSDISYAVVYNGLGVRLSYAADRGLRKAVSVDRLSIPSVLHMGITMRFPSSEVDRIVTLSLANEKLFGLRGIYYKAGLEMNMTRWLQLRMGLVVTPDVTGPRYGLGVLLAGTKFDYAYSPGMITPRFHELTISIPFDDGSSGLQE